MKKLSFAVAALAAIVLGSCGKQETIQTDNHEIGFGTYAPKSRAATGSVLSGTNFAAGATISVYAWNTGAAAFAQGATAPDFMKNDGASGNGSVVTLSANPGSTPSANYTPVKFWPSDEANNKLSFIGFYPAGATPGYSLVWTSASDVVNGSITVPAASTSQIDFMASDVENDKVYSGTTNGNVELKFHHLMSQVRVLVKTDAQTDEYLGKTDGTAPVLTVSAISFSGVKNSGLLTTTYASGTTNHVMAADGDGTETYNFSPATPLDLKGSSTAAKFLPTGGTSAADADAYLLVPQALVAGAQKVSVSYTITYSDNTVSNQTIEKDLYEGSIKSWGQNQKITYTFTIGLKPITFTTSLTDWEDKTVDPITF